MPTAVYFLGQQSVTSKGQVQLSVLMSFPLPLCLCFVCLVRHLSKLYCAQVAELGGFLPVALEFSQPVFIIWLCLQNKSSFSYSFTKPNPYLPPPLCHLLFALTTTVTVSCACHLLPEYYKAVIIGHFEIHTNERRSVAVRDDLVLEKT